MCVPVRFNSSRSNCTSRVRGSTMRVKLLPLTFTATPMRSGIQVRDLHVFTTSALKGSFDSELRQHSGCVALVPGGTAHVRDWLSHIRDGCTNLLQARCRK